MDDTINIYGKIVCNLVIFSKHSNFSGKSSDATNALAGSTNQNVSEFLALPIKQWNVDVICAWFEQMGLFMYIADVRRHLRSGNQLLEVISHFSSILCLDHEDKLWKDSNQLKKFITTKF